VAPFNAFNLGSRCGDDPTAVTANRAALIDALQLTTPPLWLNQVHGTRVCEADVQNAALDLTADAIISRSPNVAGVVLTADCLPVLVCAAQGGEIAAIHAGWRGLCAGVIEQCIGRMSTPPEKLLVWLGPAIGAKAYEVGVEVRDAFLAKDKGAESAFQGTRPGHWHCDLYALARRRLVNIGVQQIYGGHWCTHSDPVHFYSHRRDGVTGRMASLIWLNT
jgi:YfiH family protein